MKAIKIVNTKHISFSSFVELERWKMLTNYQQFFNGGLGFIHSWSMGCTKEEEEKKIILHYSGIQVFCVM